MRKIIWGGDTETLDGAPITFQFYSEQANRTDMIWIDGREPTRVLLEWLNSLVSHAQHVVYVHNLEFDMVSFLWDIKEKLVSTQSGEFELTLGDWVIKGVYGAPTFARFSNRKSSKTVVMVDSFSYYRASLAKAATVFCPDLPKLDRPEGLGSRMFKKTDTKFCAYAMRDSEVAYHIGLALEKLHEEFDLTQTVSVADMAARIFKHHFLAKTIPQPPRAIMECALNAYHGGKNNLAVPPGWYQGVHSLDVSSAYPDAMHSFPSFYHAKLYTKFKARSGVKRVPDLGVYQVSGKVSACLWPSLFAHDFSPIRGETVDGLCVSGYELNEAIRSGEFKPSNIVGWFYDRERDNDEPPLKGYVEDFYGRKESEKDPPKRAMYKFLLNSVSGKFIQTRKNEPATLYDVDSDKLSTSSDLVAGGMFHPFIAASITAHTREKIHRMEHKYKAMHTATDGIFTRMLPKEENQSGLGAMVHEASGDLLLLRNKLYILYGATGKTDSQVYPGQKIIKAALHGFAGTVTDLETLVATGERSYNTVKVNKLRSSLKRGAVPNLFSPRANKLNVGVLGVYPKGKG